jgi:hypothetical protein
VYAIHGVCSELAITVSEEDGEEDTSAITTVSPTFQAENFLFGPNMSTHPHLANAGTDLMAVDCKFTHWSPWSTCSVSCGQGFKTKTRTIKVTLF